MEFKNSNDIVNKLFGGDNLEWLRQFPSESVDLIYLDPPFRSGKNWKTVDDETQDIKSFDDIDSTFGDGTMEGYLIVMKLRLDQLKRILKPTGSIYLHCDPHASHYLKILMDGIFTSDNFKNDIIWKRKHQTTGKGISRFAQNNDNILFYTKSNIYTFNQIKIKNKIDKDKCHHDTLGYFKSAPADNYSQETIDKMLKDNRAYISSGGIDLNQINFGDLNFKNTIKYRTKTYLEEIKNKQGEIEIYDTIIIDNIWLDVPNMMHVSKKERSHKYPTQKPEKLLERIILASSNENDIILDPFCGSGTSLFVAKKLNRKFIGIDHYPPACITTAKRLNVSQENIKILDDEFLNGSNTKTIDEIVSELENYTFYKLQEWVCQKLGFKNTGNPIGSSGADGGYDGIRIVESNDYNGHELLEVKSGKNGISNDHVLKMHGILQLNHIKRALLVGFSFSDLAKESAKSLSKDGILIKIYTIRQVVSVEKTRTMGTKKSLLSLLDGKYSDGQTHF